MDAISNLCKRCNICTFMPVQESERVMAVTPVNTEPVVLIIDNAYQEGEWISGLEMSTELLGLTSFTYTSTIRCTFTDQDVARGSNDHQKALQSCSVWTNFLLEGRAVIISTMDGLQQMKIEKIEDKEVGKVFRNARFGIVVVTPPIHSFNQNLIDVYRPKIDRALKEVRLR